jgi:hypothetical protein
LALGSAALLELFLGSRHALASLGRAFLEVSPSSLASLVGAGHLALSFEPARALLFAALFFALPIALRRVGTRRLRMTRVLLGIDGLVVLGFIGTTLALDLGAPALAVPVAVWGLWVLASFGMGAALLTALSLSALLGLMLPSEFPLWPLLLRALLPALLMRKSHRAFAGFSAALGSGFLVALLLLLPAVGFNGNLPDRSWALHSLIGGLLDGILFVVGRTSAEAALGHVSRERLHDLLDLKQPLLCRMMERAPGSFEHSRAMANLAEQAASAIGADALLTRVGAYYHDLGKSCRPDHFIENLEAGQPSPHEQLEPLESARRIREHVPEGVRLLRRGGIPEPVVEFAYTHHGTQRVEYFLNRQKQLCEKSGESLDEEAFRYPGMKPMTRETAILMLVDSIEAASRTLDNPGPSEIEEMLRRIVFAKLKGGQLDDSGLSMKELRLACERVGWTLLAMNHHRIKYPWQEEKGDAEKGKAAAKTRPQLAVLTSARASEKLSS